MTARELLFAADGRLQPPWRILLFLLLGASSILVVTIALRPLLVPLENAIGIRGVAVSYGTAIALLVAHWLTLRSFDQRPYAFVWLDRVAARKRVLAYGWVLGAAPIALACGVLFAAGWLEVQPAPAGSWWKGAIQISLLLLPAALYEELLVRGYVFAVLREWIGPVAAITLTSVVFGLLHVPNPGSNPLPIAVVMLAGVYLAVVLLATRSLYAAWLAHWAWNWTLAVPLHLPVSGLDFEAPDYKTVETGPDWITGGPWGPEGGIIAAVGLLGGLVFLYYRRSAGGKNAAHGPVNGNASG